MSGDAWDDYVRRVLDPQDKVLFEEAVRCARAGARRAAYIAIWLACAESIKRKFKDASQFDGVAIKIVGEIAEKETKHQAVDAFMLTKAKEYGFISDSEFSHLNAIYEQRCVYGHPYEQAPLSEQLIAAVASVIEYVLGRPTKLSYGYLERQADLICSNLTFLDDHFPAIGNYAQIVHVRSSSDLHLWFLRKLWEKARPLANDPSMALFMRRVVWFSTAFLGLCEADFFAAWDVVQQLTEYPFISYALATSDLFPKVGEHSQDIIVGNLLNAAITHSASLKVIEDLHAAGKLTQRQTDRFTAVILEIPLNVVASSGVEPQPYVNRVIADLKSHNWYVQNPAIDVLVNIGPSGIGKCPKAMQQELGNNVLQVADGTGKNAVILLSEISRGSKEWPDFFIEGIVTECFVNDENKFRFKTNCATEALQCLRAVTLNKRAPIVTRIVDRLRHSSPKYAWSMDNREQMLKSIDDAIASDELGLAALGALRDAVANL